jgi:hypothetical protein
MEIVKQIVPLKSNGELLIKLHETAAPGGGSYRIVFFSSNKHGKIRNDANCNVRPFIRRKSQRNQQRF